MMPAWPVTGNRSLKIYLAFSGLLLLTLGLAIYRQNIFLLALPLAVALLGLILTNYTILYYLLLIAIPFSMEVELPGGLGTDLFSEPLIILLAACYVGSRLLGKNPDPFLWQHHLVKFMLILLGWAIVTSFSSVDYLKTGKYLVAKCWYLLVFLFLTASLLKSPAVIRRFFYFFIGALSVVVAITLVRHALVGFTFAQVNKIVSPFLRNHVMYGALSAAALPYALYLFLHQKIRVYQILIGFICLLLFSGVLLSYTRASWLSLPLAVGYAISIRRRLTKYLLFFSLIIALGVVGYMNSNYRYMQYAPDYTKTIFNKDNITKHLEATYKLEDVSGMERIYRWLAAARMIADRPLMGSGPNTFYTEYKKYTVSRFTTYVSENPEKSTVHNYFLLQFAEQGYAGGILFLLFMGYVLLLPEKIYHRAASPGQKRMVLAAGLCLFIITVHLVLNELLETDKIGALFYISIAVLIRADEWTAYSTKENPALRA